MTKEERISRATELFKSGYNCSQSVVAAFADMYGFTEEQALRMAASFGGGIGRKLLHQSIIGSLSLTIGSVNCPLLQSGK